MYKIFGNTNNDGMLFSALFAIAAEINGFVCAIYLILYDR